LGEENNSVKTRFLPANDFWKRRTTHGRSKIFATPEILYAACLEYFEDTDKNPLYECKSYMYQGEIIHDFVPKMRAMTISGLCIFLGVGKDAWADYRKNPDFSAVCESVEEAIRTQKLQGAAADMLNASIIAREIGLADKSAIDHTTNGKDMPDIGIAVIEAINRKHES